MFDSQTSDISVPLEQLYCVIWHRESGVHTNTTMHIVMCFGQSAFCINISMVVRRSEGVPNARTK